MGFEIRIDFFLVWLKSLTNQKLERLEILKIILHKKLIHIFQLSTLRLKDVYSFSVKFNQFKQELNLTSFEQVLCTQLLYDGKCLEASHPFKERSTKSIMLCGWLLSA
jgi:hypothetical protein